MWIYVLLIAVFLMSLWSAIVTTLMGIYLVRLNEKPPKEDMIPDKSDTGLIDITTPQQP